MYIFLTQFHNSIFRANINQWQSLGLVRTARQTSGTIAKSFYSILVSRVTKNLSKFDILNAEHPAHASVCSGMKRDKSTVQSLEFAGFEWHVYNVHSLCTCRTDDLLIDWVSVRESKLASTAAVQKRPCNVASLGFQFWIFGIKTYFSFNEHSGTIRLQAVRIVADA